MSWYASSQKSWFETAFGFNEVGRKAVVFEEVRNAFKLEGQGNDTKLVVKKNNWKFALGLFETPSVLELHKKAGALLNPELTKRFGGITFKNIIGDSKTLHLDPKNEGAVFQAASQFNCLEMVGPGVKPERGITGYANDLTQGPVCAMACPAATVFRNYFAGAEPLKGQAGGNQLDTTIDIAKLVNNAKHNYWWMSNGYLMPVRQDSIKELNKRFEEKVLIEGRRMPLFEAMSWQLRVGVHWSTETAKVKDRRPHQVCQVFSSALPLSYCRTPKRDFEHLGPAILNGTYDATLAVGATLAAQHKRRVTVFLTCVGGGVFGNPHRWITHAIQRALTRWSHAPLDVKLVHYRSISGGGYRDIRVPRGVGRGLNDSVQALKIMVEDEKKIS